MLSLSSIISSFFSFIDPTFYYCPIFSPFLTYSFFPYYPLLLQEDARADVVDCVVRDIQNSQCMLNVEYSGATCPHVTILFGDTKEDVGLGLVKEGLVMVDVRKEKHLQKMVSEDKYTVEGGRDSYCTCSKLQFGSIIDNVKLNYRLCCFS